MRELPPRLKKIMNLKLHNIDRILDIGCGNGLYGVTLKNTFNSKEIYGVDLAREKAEENGVEFSCTDVDNSPLPYKDEFFDLVFAGEVIEHMLHPDHFLSEIYRVMKQNSYCIITTPNIANWYDRILLLCGWQPYSIPPLTIHRGIGTFLSRARNTKVCGYQYIYTSIGIGLPHVQHLTRGASVSLMKYSGFKVIKTLGTPSEQFTFNINKVAQYLIWKLDTFIATYFPQLASGVIIIAKKTND